MFYGLTKRLTVVFLLLGTVLVANMVFFFYEIRVRDRAANWVRHSRTVLSAITSAESVLKDAETGQRGYLLTGNLQYLAPYEQARLKIDPELDYLRDLTTEDPLQQERLREIRSLAHEKLEELAITVKLVQDGKRDEAIRIMGTSFGRLKMELIRERFNNMRVTEDELLGERQEDWGKARRSFIVSIISATLLSVGILVWLAYATAKVYLDIKLHSEDLAVRQNWFEAALTSIGDAVLTTDHNGIVTFVNPVAGTVLDRSPEMLVGKELTSIFQISNELTGAPAENPVYKAISTGQVVLMANHTVLTRHDGLIVPIEDSAAPLRDRDGKLHGVVLIFRDVSQEKVKQELMRQHEKLAVTSRLAASIAHELNNPLEAVMNYIYLITMMPDVPPSALSYAEGAMSELMRVSHIAKLSLGFYKDTGTPKAFDPASSFAQIIHIYNGKILSQHIEVKYDTGAEVFAFANEGEVRQIVSNLVSNAVDAMPNGGKLRISSRREVDGCQVLIEVEDEGKGIDSETLPRIFEPFFTTKHDVGTGLGLWVSKALAEKNSGDLSVISKSNGHARGTKFILALPSADSVSRAATASSE